MNLDLLEEENEEVDEDAVLPPAQLSRPGSSISDRAQHSLVPCEVDLHNVYKRASAQLATEWPASQDDGARRGTCMMGKFCPPVRCL